MPKFFVKLPPADGKSLLSGRVVEVLLDQKDLIYHLVRHLEMVEGVEADQHRLMLAGRYLESDQSIADSGICDDSTVWMSRKLDLLKRSPEKQIYIRRCSPTPFIGSKPVGEMHHRFVEYQLPLETTIAEIKQRVATDYGWPVNDLRMVIGGREVEPDTRLESYRRWSRVVFHLIFW